MHAVIVGTGFGQYAMAPAYQALGWEVTLLSPRETGALRKALQNGCDLLSIHAPPFLHRKLVALAGEYCCPVLCDKPFGCNSEDAEAMLTTASQAGILHFLNFEFRFDPLWQKMRLLLEAGAIGTPLHLSSSMYLSRGRQVKHSWLFEKDKGGGWIGAYASHVVDKLHWLFGEIDRVHCQSRIDMPQREHPSVAGRMMAATAEDALSATFHMANGVTASLDTAFAAATDVPGRIVLLGSEGSIEITQGVALHLRRADGHQEEHRLAEGQNAMQSALQGWLDTVGTAIEEGRQITPNFADGLRCARVLEKMRGESGFGAVKGPQQ